MEMARWVRWHCGLGFVAPVGLTRKCSCYCDCGMIAWGQDKLDVRFTESQGNETSVEHTRFHDSVPRLAKVTLPSLKNAQRWPYSLVSRARYSCYHVSFLDSTPGWATVLQIVSSWSCDSSVTLPTYYKSLPTTHLFVRSLYNTRYPHSLHLIASPFLRVTRVSQSPQR